MNVADPTEELVSHKDPQHHITSPATYYLIFGVLLILTAVTVGVAFVDLGRMNTPVALAIAMSKATLVILYFMHVRHSTRLTWVILIASFMTVGILFVLTLADYLTRGLLTY
ncbi:MAG TPA: cytochrome C oxidase subunit IV family protein [Thermoanaerobaculia bacterium]|nr:cytochrome C oxidase subunit IV family protein [Thermoanaerobaculia bacterium]